MRKIWQFFKENPTVSVTLTILVLFVASLFGYRFLTNNPETLGVANTFNPISNANNTSSRGIKSIVKDLPSAEEIFRKYASEDTVDVEGEPITIEDVIFNNYSEEVYALYQLGLIPSDTLDEIDNDVIIQAGNAYIDENYNFYTPKFLYNTKNYIDSLGTEYISDEIYVESGMFDFESENQYIKVSDSKSLDLDNIIVQGISVETVENANFEKALGVLKTLNLATEQEIVSDNFNIVAKVSDYKLINVNYIVKKDVDISKIKEKLLTISLNNESIIYIEETYNMNFPSLLGESEMDVIDYNNNIMFNPTEYVYKNKSDSKVEQYSYLTATFVATNEQLNGSSYIRFGESNDALELIPSDVNTIYEYGIYDSIRND